MAEQRTVEERVKDGVITKDAEDGRIVSVRTAKGVDHASEESLRVIERTADRFDAALRRLADR